jgi:hypothetical protein
MPFSRGSIYVNFSLNKPSTSWRLKHPFAAKLQISAIVVSLVGCVVSAIVVSSAGCEQEETTMPDTTQPAGETTINRFAYCIVGWQSFYMGNMA